MLRILTVLLFVFNLLFSPGGISGKLLKSQGVTVMVGGDKSVSTFGSLLKDSEGTTYQRYGSAIKDSKGGIWQRFGNSIKRKSDGKTCVIFGQSIKCN